MAAHGPGACRYPYDARMAHTTGPTRRRPAIPASLLRTPTRPSFFEGRLLSAADLRLEQDYQDHKRHLLNLAAVGAGVVTGLAVSVDTDGTGLTVSAGLAIDGLGREIIVPADTRVPWPTPDGLEPRRWGAVIEFAQQPADPVATADGPVSSTVAEGATVTVITARPAPDDTLVVLQPYDRGSAGTTHQR
jgi:hypothetical protein